MPKYVRAMSENAKKLVDGSLDLVTLPDVYLRVKEVLEDPKSSAADMANAIQTDPATTARLLRMANSPFFGFAAQGTECFVTKPQAHAAFAFEHVGAGNRTVNEQGRIAADGARILSAYRTAENVRLWIITEADRSATTILLPEEY